MVRRALRYDEDIGKCKGFRLTRPGDAGRNRCSSSGRGSRTNHRTCKVEKTMKVYVLWAPEQIKATDGVFTTRELAEAARDQQIAAGNNHLIADDFVIDELELIGGGAAKLVLL